MGDGFGGPSAATPHLGGLMCLVLSAAPHLNPEQVCQIIQTTAVQTTSDPSPTKDNNYGAGRIDCLGAVCAAENAGNGVRRLLITELSSGNPDYAEITNFTTSAIDLTGWTLDEIAAISDDGSTVVNSSTGATSTISSDGTKMTVQSADGTTAFATKTDTGVTIELDGVTYTYSFGDAKPEVAESVDASVGNEAELG